MKLYNIVVCGEILPNFTQNQVQENLIRFLKIPDHFAPKFLLKNRINFKKEVSIEESRKYLFALEKCGLQGHLEEVLNEETQSQRIDAPSLTTKTPLKPKKQRLMMNPSGMSLDSLGLMSDEESQILSEASLTAQVPVKSKGQSIEVSGSSLDSLGLMSDEESQILSEANLTAQVPVKSKGQSIEVSGSTLDSLGLISDEESQILSEAALTVQAPIKSKGQSIELSGSALDALELMVDKEPLNEISFSVKIPANEQSPTLSGLSLMLDEQDEAQKITSPVPTEPVLAPIELSLVAHELANQASDQRTPDIEEKIPQTHLQPNYQANAVSEKNHYDDELDESADESVIAPSFFGINRDGRYGRLNFVNAHAVFLGALVVYILAAALMPIFSFFILLPFVIYMLYYKFRIIVLRIQDIGLSSGLVWPIIAINAAAERTDNMLLVLLVLVIDIGLCLFPGAKDSNDHGPPSIQGKPWGVFGFIAGIAIIAAITFMYDDYATMNTTTKQDYKYSLEYENE